MSDKTIRTEFLIHDLKVPIAVIDAGAKLLLEQQDVYGVLSNKQIKVLKRILRNARVTRGLVNDVLEQGKSRQKSASVCDVSIASILSSVLTEIFDLLDPSVSENIAAAQTYADFILAVHDSGIQMSFDEKLWNSQMCLDQRKIRQILRNLVTNAFKYRNDFIKISGCIEQNFIIFTVEDDGSGIPKENQYRIFDSYFSHGVSLHDAVQGHGLGLTGVQVLLEDMGGALDLESDKGKGACFTISIPLRD